jgi:non-specific serine/threonine protein kinase
MVRLALLALGLALSAGAADACPDWSLSGHEFRARASELYTPYEYRLIAGGDIRIDGCGIRNMTDGKPTGYAMRQPDVTFRFEQDGRYQLEFRVVSACDSMLLVNTGGANWYWDDDDNGNLDPRIRLTRPSQGWYDIWVGTIGPDTCDAILIIETF